MKYRVLKIVIFSLLAISNMAYAELSEYEKTEKRSSTWKYEIVLNERLDTACGRGFGSSETLGIGLDAVKEKSAPCIDAKKILSDYKEYLYNNNDVSSNDKSEYAYEKMNTHKQEQDFLERQPYITTSIGKYVFRTFYKGLAKWVGADGNSAGKFQVFAKEITPALEKSMVLLIIIFASAAFFNKFTQYLEKAAKAFLAFVIVLSFLEWNTFNDWIFEPLLSLLIATMKVLFDSNAQGLGDVIFGVDEHFEKLFASIEAYDKLLEEKGVWYSFQVFKQIVAYLIIGMFGALYAIFTILIIVGFFGFMLLLGFAPVFMAIGIFNKGIFFAWLKTTMNYFLIPIFTAAVMSVTVAFIQEAATAIEGLSPTDSIFIRDVGFVFLVGIFSIGLHWKAPEFAAAITGGMASGAGSIVGTATAVGAAAWGLSKSPIGGGKNLTNVASGFKGGNLGNSMSGGYRGGQVAEAVWNRLRSGGTK